MITLRDQGTGGGADVSVTSKKEGDLAISYGGSGTISGDLGQTSYGMQLDELIKGNIVGFDVVGGNVIPC